MPSLAFTADSRQTEAGRLYNRSEEDETRIPLQKAIDDADYEHGHRVNELDFLTAFRSPVMVARKSNCAFNTVRISSTGRPWIVDNDSRGGDDEHAQPNAELAIELTAPPTPPFDADATRRCRRRCRPPHSRCCRRPPRAQLHLSPPPAAALRRAPPSASAMLRRSRRLTARLPRIRRALPSASLPWFSLCVLCVARHYRERVECRRGCLCVPPEATYI